MIPFFLVIFAALVAAVVELAQGRASVMGLSFSIIFLIGVIVCFGWSRRGEGRAWVSSPWLPALRWAVFAYPVATIFLGLTIQDAGFSYFVGGAVTFVTAVWYFPLLVRSVFLFRSSSVWIEGEHLYVRSWFRERVVPLSAVSRVDPLGPFWSGVFGWTYPEGFGSFPIHRFWKSFVEMEEIFASLAIIPFVGEKFSLVVRDPQEGPQVVRLAHPDRMGDGPDGMAQLLKMKRA